MHTLARAAADSDYCLHHLSDPDLLASTRSQVGRSNQILATLLAHLAEVEARGIFRLRACSSLYTYCIYELRMSEDAALRRVHAARILRRFPLLYEQIAAGELHLTAVLMLGPHLTEANHVEVLARAKHRTKKEVQSLVRQLDPLPDVPACIEPLGPFREAGPSSPPSNPSAGEWMTSLCGPIRELPPGERPRDWVEAHTNDAFGVEFRAERGTGDASGPANSSERLEPLGPQRFKVQFTASQEYVELLEEARDLLAPAVPNRALDEIHLRALRLLVAELKKRKYALTDKPRAPREGNISDSSESTALAVPVGGRAERASAPGAVSVGSESKPEPTEGPRELSLASMEAAYGLDETRVAGELAENHARADSTRAGNPRWRGRYVAAAVRRAVAERDRERCAYVDDNGRRCRETSCLEFHHLEPHACGGPPTVENLSLRCRAHNGLAAERDFGREFMAKKKTAPHRPSAPSK